MRFLVLIAKNLRRNVLRTALSVVGTMVLVLVVTLVWSILSFLDEVTADKSANFKAIMTEKWRIPSRMPYAYVLRSGGLHEGGYAGKPGDIRPTDYMSWQFYGGVLEKGVSARENFVFGIGMEPEKILTMLDELDSLGEPQRSELAAAVERLKANRQGMILGRDRLTAMNKEVGNRIKLFGLIHKDIDLEFEIVGTFPPGRYDNSMVFRGDYLNGAMDAYKSSHSNIAHPLAEQTLNLVWLRVPDKESLARISEQIEREYGRASPAVKCETQSAGISSFLEAYKDLLWGMRYLLAPAVMVTLSLVIANAISISVRERRLELAVLKVLGFQPWKILTIVLGEAVLVGAVAGLVSAVNTYLLVNFVLGGIKFPIAFFPAFFIPLAALWWGPVLGSVAALSGSVLPALGAMRVKVSDVFAKVT